MVVNPAVQLYLLERNDSRYYFDETKSAVVAAESRHQARVLAQAEFGDELDGVSTWLENTTTVAHIGTASYHVSPGVVHAHDVRG